MNPTDPAQSGFRISGPALLLASWILIGLPIALLPPGQINQDTYNHLATANAYFHANGWHIHDSYTVGPVIPGILAIIKWLLLGMGVAGPNVDVAIVKLVAFACYVAVSLAAVGFCAGRSIRLYAAAFTLCLLFFTLPQEQDVASLNGDLVSVAFLSMLLVVSARPEWRRRDYALITVLALLVLYTKLQSVLLLALALVTCGPRQSRIKLALVLLPALASTETGLWFAGGGWAAKLYGFSQYLTHVPGHQHAVGLSLVAVGHLVYSRIIHLGWMIGGTLWFFPLASAVLIVPLTERTANDGRLIGRWAAWVAVTALTLFIPGRPYSHYLLYFVPVMFLFLPVALERTRLHPPRPWVAWALVAACVVIKFCTLMPNPASFGGERYWHLIPKQVISTETAAAKAQLQIGDRDAIYVHGWDYRFYSYFGKSSPDLGIMGVRDGTMTPEEYINRLLALNPTYIFDVVNHAGLVRDPNLSLSARPEWIFRIKAKYEKVFDQGGLTVYRRRDTAPAAGK